MYHSNIYLMDINIIITPSFSFPFLRVKVKMSQTHDSKIQPVEIPESLPLIPHLRQEAARLRISRADKTTINRTTAINNLSKFLMEKIDGGAGITAYNLTPEHIRAFERWQLDRGVRLSTSANDMRNLRALFNSINNRGTELFGKVHTSNAQSHSKAVDSHTVSRIESIVLKHNSPEEMARDYFMFSFYAMGIPPIDMARLKKKSLQGDTLIYYRRKTHRMVTIPVDERLRMLTDRITPNDFLYLLPILKSDNTTKAGKEYRRFYQRYRYGLAKLAKLLGDNISLTAYTPRHSWASIAYEAGVSPNIISQVYGHANTKTTYAYLANISNDHIKEARRIVNNYIKMAG